MHDMNHRAPNNRDVMQAIRGTALVAILTTGVAALAAAQSSSLPASPPPQGVAAANRAAAAQLGGLELTADQKARVEAITAKYAGASRAAMEGLATDREDGLKKLMALREKMLPEFRAVLTAPQRVIFDRNMAEMKSWMTARP